jgi:hypothetical protein
MSGQMYRVNPCKDIYILQLSGITSTSGWYYLEKLLTNIFEGKKAEEVKIRTQSIAGIFRLKMGPDETGAVDWPNYTRVRIDKKWKVLPARTHKCQIL